MIIRIKPFSLFFGSITTFHENQDKVPGASIIDRDNQIGLIITINDTCTWDLVLILEQ